MTAFLLCEICAEAGLPNGVLNVVHGTGPNVGAAITAHPTITTISFTGGTVTGRKRAEACAPLFKKVSPELGGEKPQSGFLGRRPPAPPSRGPGSFLSKTGQGFFFW